jgi:hypothetical protein
VLQLHDLQGNVIATAGPSETETKLLSKYNSTEFGVPVNGTPPTKYSWLGASGVAPELASSGATSQGGTGYIPQLGERLQTQPVVSPGAPNGLYIAPYQSTQTPGGYAASAKFAAEEPAREAARQLAAEEEACRAAPDSCSEDPSWSGDVSIPVAEAISGALEGIEYVDALSGSVAEKIIEGLAEVFHTNWLTQMKTAIQQGIFGYSMDDVKHWAFSIGTLLDTCTKVTTRYKDPHCWLYIPTVVRHTRKNGPGFEVPDFAAPFGWNDPKAVAVGYCPWGTNSRCYNANAI